MTVTVVQSPQNELERSQIRGWRAYASLLINGLPTIEEHTSKILALPHQSFSHKINQGGRSLQEEIKIEIPSLLLITVSKSHNFNEDFSSRISYYGSIIYYSQVSEEQPKLDTSTFKNERELDLLLATSHKYLTFSLHEKDDLSCALFNEIPQRLCGKAMYEQLIAQHTSSVIENMKAYQAEQAIFDNLLNEHQAGDFSKISRNMSHEQLEMLSEILSKNVSDEHEIDKVLAIRKIVVGDIQFEIYFLRVHQIDKHGNTYPYDAVVLTRFNSENKLLGAIHYTSDWDEHGKYSRYRSFFAKKLSPSSAE